MYFFIRIFKLSLPISYNFGIHIIYLSYSLLLTKARSTSVGLNSSFIDVITAGFDLMFGVIVCIISGSTRRLLPPMCIIF